MLDGTYGAAATSVRRCGSATLWQLLLLLLGLLDHLEGTERDHHPAGPSWALSELGDRDRDGVLHELPGSAPLCADPARAALAGHWDR